MSATIDAALLLHASDVSSPRHEPARRHLDRLATGPDLLYLFWPVLLRYLHLATDAAVFARPLAPEAAMGNIEGLLALDHVRTGAEDARFWELFKTGTQPVAARGDLVAEAHVVALMRQHGVVTIWTGARTYWLFEGVRARDPYPPRLKLK